MRGIGVLPGQRLAMVDHLVPLCHLMDIPLLCTDRWTHDLIEIFYPFSRSIFEEAPDFSLQNALNTYDLFFYVDLHRYPHHFFQFYDYTYRGKARSVCGLHGCSDKKRHHFWAERYANEDVVLIYGRHMQEFIEEKSAWQRLKKIIFTGNFRYQYYKEYREFFDKKYASFLFPDTGRKTLLYAPTWTSPKKKKEGGLDHTSAFEAHPFILDSIPEEYQVIVKFHPLVHLLYPEEIENLKLRYGDSEQVLFFDNLPLIYPLLSKVDIYVGDYSSIGYDFLTFDRPLFFFNEYNRFPETDKGVQLFQCGTPISPADYSKFYLKIERGLKQDHHSLRKYMYDYAFGDEKSLPTLKREIEEALLR